MDPRIAVIDKRLEHIRKIIAVSGGKGGIGKSSVASMLALVLARAAKRVGLLDLDFCGPSTHIILGIRDVYPHEEKGIVPPIVYTMRYMSIVFYAGDRPSPLRGNDLSNAIIELLSITQWGTLDFLVVDMPPGISDTTLDTIRLMRRTQFVNVSTPSKLAFETVKKVVQMQRDLALPVVGVIENMKRTNSAYVADGVRALRVPYLGSVAYDDCFENALGNVDSLVSTQFAADVKHIVQHTDTFDSGTER
jgi:ATP-binding protein involved in chromosome partitioning